MFQGFDELDLVVVDQHLSAELPAAFEFFLGTGGHRDVRADGPGPLDRERADPAASAVDQHPFPGLQLGGHGQVRVHGACDLGDCRSAHRIDPGRQGHHLPKRNGHLLGVAAAGQQGANVLAIELG